MGRWAQKRRTGGGSSATELVHMLTVTSDGFNTGVIKYSADVNQADFDPANFDSFPDGGIGTAINQFNPDELQILFIGPTLTDALMNYAGSAPGVLTPDSVAY